MKFLPTVAVLFAVLVATAAFAAEIVKIEIISVDEQSGRMAVSVTVVGEDGRPITGLSAANFQVALEDAPLSLSDVLTASSARVPASVLLLVDVSGSMQGEPMKQARSAIQEFIRNLDPVDQVAIVTFGSEVRLLQEFTSNRSQLTQAVGRLTPVGDTALYDAVIQGAEMISAAPAGRRLVVLLSDGQATIGKERRAASLEAARAGGVGIIALGLGADIDRQYLTELAAVSGGRFLEAPTPASLRAAYVDLATAIRSQYTLIVSVPPAVDRSVPGRLTVRVALSSGSATAERLLNPLPGAKAPPFDLSLSGLKSGQSVKSPVSVQPTAAAGVALVRVEYWLDGQLLNVATSEPFTYHLDPAQVAKGSHLLEVVAMDARGRPGEAQLPFSVAAPSRSILPSGKLLLFIALALAAAAAAGALLRKKRRQLARFADRRVKPWAGRLPEIDGPVDGWPQPVAPPPPPAPAAALGRVVVMDELGVRAGRLDVIHEYEIRSTPLTFGTGRSCDIRVEDDDGGRIAAEEARLWVRGGRLVYHKLTTLSAMATEGVTSGWRFLESGEELRIGPYCLIFQLEAPLPALEGEAEGQAEVEPEGEPPPQEHGMALREPRTAS